MNNLDYEERIAFMLRLKTLIKKYLELCDTSNTPYLCEHIKNSDGYDEVVEFCVSNFINNETPIGDSLVQKENMLNPNYLTD